MTSLPCPTFLSRFMIITVVMIMMAMVNNVVTKSAAFVSALQLTRKSGAAKAPVSPLVEEALSCYPFAFRPDNEKPNAKGRPKYATTKSQATNAFNELARLYGDESAMKIVQIQPMSLCFNANNFAPCLDAWTEQFGLESAQAMVVRNPGLLAVPPVLAAEPAEASMALSYVVAITRPLPKIILCGGILAILTAGFR